MNQDMGKIQSFTGLHAWKKGHMLVVKIYEVTKGFPSAEMFGLTKQIRSAVVSITSNIAEGFSRRSYGDKSHFYSIALGSLTEVQNQLFIARDIGYLPSKDFQNLAKDTVEVNTLINGLIRKSRSILHS